MRNTSNAGFSLIEVLVALVVLTVGVLAVARSMAAMNRLLTAGSVLTAASVMGTNQMESLIAGGCNGAASSQSSVGGIHISWGTTVPSGGSLRFSVTLAYPLDHKRRVSEIAYFLPCPNGV